MPRSRVILIPVLLLLLGFGAACFAGSATPPALTISDGDSSVNGGLGTYCWTRGGVGRSGTCGDTFAIITTDPPLAALDEHQLEGELHGQDLTSIDVTAYPVGGAGGATIMRQRSEHVAWIYGQRQANLPATVDGSRFEIDLSLLDAGQYLVSVTCYVEDRGDANYGFLLDKDVPGA